jgi:hypothetical protein
MLTIEIICATCKTVLCKQSLTENSIIQVKPCENCLDDSVGDGYDEGYNDGYTSGYADGRAAGFFEGTK